MVNKIHYAEILFRGNESDTITAYSETACGRYEFEEHTDKWDQVTCKACLKKRTLLRTINKRYQNK